MGVLICSVLSVHYKYPEFLVDQSERIRICAKPTSESLGADLRYHPVVHRGSNAEVIEAAQAAFRSTGLHGGCVDLRNKPEGAARGHGDSLTEAFLEVARNDAIGDDDLIAVMDHDTHPVDVNLFAAVGEKLTGRKTLAGIGVPQWHRGHCYLHPSFLMARVGTIRQMGPGRAFKMRFLPERNDLFWDVGEGFTIWCEQNGREILPLRVHDTRFPWSSWDSEMVPGNEAVLVGEHGEHVHVGNLMRYGLEEDRPLLSHLWAGPLPGKRGRVRDRVASSSGKYLRKHHVLRARLKPFWRKGSRLFSEYDEREMMAAYLAEPLTGS